MQIIHGYQITVPFSSKDAGFCRWAYGEKDGHVYFIKEFLSPKYPMEDSGLSAAAITKKRKECEEFFIEKNDLYMRLLRCRTGNIVVIRDFFREGSRYYAVTERVTPALFPKDRIFTLPEELKYILIRSLLYSFSQLHYFGIVHADIKPDNILLKRTTMGTYTGKIIDFDSSFLEDHIPEEIQGDQVYLAPEARLRMMDEMTPVTTKADVFSLGILFHQYWCGKLPKIPAEYPYIFEAVLDGAPITLDGTLPPVLKGQIKRMLSREACERPSAEEVLEALRQGKGEPSPAADGGKKGFHSMDQLK